MNYEFVIILNALAVILFTQEVDGIRWIMNIVMGIICIIGAIPLIFKIRE